MASFNAVCTCYTASYKAVSGWIEMLGFDRGENLFILIFIKKAEARETVHKNRESFEYGK